MIGFGGNRLDPRFALIAGLGLALPVVLSAPVPAQAPSVKLDLLKQHDKDLEKLHGEQSKAAETEAALKREIEQIGADRRKLNQDLIDTAARLRGVETKIEAAQVRLKALDDNEQALHQSLSNRQAAIGEVLAALQRVGRRPPPALMASPEDALQAVRTAMLLGAVLPEMRSQVDALAKNLSDLANVRKQIAAEQEKLKADVASLGAERARVQALVAERQKKQTDREQALEAERTRARDLARQADNLKDLIAKLEQDLGTARREGERRDSKPSLSALHDPGRLSPAVPFASLRGKVPIPVNGIRIREFGAPESTGTVEKGVSIATRAGAQVTAPADGWVVYAGPFRSYGQLLILNTGGGYHVLLAGMERISVDLGQFVLAGEPVAVMGNGSQIAALLAIGSSQPVLYVEFRKDGTPVDPGPWWAAGEGEKVRG
jgi:septal ring factor EnvC (AmiA/AmiB activator)